MKSDQLTNNTSKLFLLLLSCAMLLTGALTGAAQATFTGDYDRTNFAAPLGYQVDGQFPTPGQEVFSANVGGVLNPDGSVVAGGIVFRTANDRPDIYLRKFTASGAVDASFGTNGFVRTVFSTDFPTGIEGRSFPTVIKGQTDGKIIVGGTCDVWRDESNQNQGGTFGHDWCLVRYNANGSIDTSFGNNIVQWGNTNFPAQIRSQAVGQGRVAIQTGIFEDGTLGGSSSTLRDIAIQPDGKIVVVGQTRDLLNPGGAQQRQSGLIVRFNANGSLDASFGTGGYARYSATNPVVPNCYPFRGFHGVTIQPDGRIIALGNDGTTNAGCFRGFVFVITRWSANGILETARRLDDNTSISAIEKATAAIITRDGGKLLVSGSYQTRPTLLRMNLSDLSVDTTFGTTGIVGYAPIGGDGGQQSLYIKAIQPDGKILGVDTASLLGNGIVRFTANGTGDLSFGNFGWDHAASFGRLRLTATWFRGNTPTFTASDLVLRPDGRFVAFGQLSDGQAIRSFVSQHTNDIPIAQFSSATYSVNEAANSISLMVTRTGNTAQAASVAYATSTDTTFVNCATQTSAASSRCDFTAASGTINFAAGETSKTINILINDDVFVETNETLQVTLSNPANIALGMESATVTILDNDTTPPAANPNDAAPFFARTQYSDFLARVPDQAGLDFWTGQITQCGADAACTYRRRYEVSNAFFFELEFQRSGAYVYRLYRAAFGNTQPFPNSGANSGSPILAAHLPSYAVFDPDRARVDAANLAASQLALANDFAARTAFTNRYPATQTADQFVDALIANIQTASGVSLASQRAALINLHNSGGRGAVLYRLADDDAAGNPVNNRPFIDAEYNRSFVLTQYFGYLRRDPDLGGINFWFGQVTRFPLRDARGQNGMVCGFINSGEYQTRFSSVVTQNDANCPQ